MVKEFRMHALTAKKICKEKS